MKIDIEETKRVAKLYGIEIVPIDDRNTNETIWFKDGHGKTVAYFKNGSSITPVDDESVRSKEKDMFISGINKYRDYNGMILFLEEFCGIKLHWYQKVHLKLMWKSNKLGVIK